MHLSTHDEVLDLGLLVKKYPHIFDEESDEVIDESLIQELACLETSS
jgi:hypothetical protein